MEARALSFDEEIKLKVTADERGAIDSLDKVDRKLKSTETSAKNLGFAIVSALASAGAASFFKGTIDQANRLEASLNRVESAARAFGQSTVKAKQAAQDLAADGFLSLNQSASALSNLMATGLNVDQSKKFITASKDIAAFGNTVNDAAGSIESGIKGILTGSTELVENMSPAMKTLSMKFTEQKNSLGPAIATQNLYNGVLKLGTQFAGDAAKYLQTTAAAQQALTASTDKASSAIGKSLQPALVAVLSVLKGIVDGFTGWFTGLDKGTASILAVGGVILSVVIPALFGFSKALVALGITATSTWTAILGPIAWIIAGVVALTAALHQLEARGRSNNIADKYLKEKEAAQAAADKLTELSKITKLSTEQEKELAAVKADLTKRAEAMGKAYNAQGKSAKELLADQEKLRNQEREFAADKVRANLKANQEALEYANSMGGFQDFLGRVRPGGITKENAIKLTTKNIEADKQALVDIYQPVSELTKKQETAILKTDAKVVRFIEMQNQFKEIEKNRLFTIASLSKKLSAEELAMAIQNANDNAVTLRNQQVGAARQLYAEFIEEKRDADMLALKLQTDAAIAANRELFNAKMIDQDELAKRQKKIDEAAARKRAQIDLQSFADTAAAANATASGFASLARAKDAGSGLSGLGGIATGISGLKGISPALGALGPLGQTIGAVGGIVSTLTGLFGKSDEERAREAAEQARRDEEAKKILELQANYQKSMLSLQEAAAKLPFENLQRQLRLIDIQSQGEILSGGDPGAIETKRLGQRQSAIQSILDEQSGSISGGALFSGVSSSPESLIGFLSDRASQSGSISLLAGLLEELRRDPANPGIRSFVKSKLLELRGKIPAELFDSVYGPIVKAEELAGQAAAVMATPASSPQQMAERTITWLNLMESSMASVNSGISSFSGLQSEVNADTSVAENLLSTLEQSLANEKAIAENTKKTAENTSLSLEKQRENMFIDVAGGGLRGFGAFMAGMPTNTSALSMPTSMASAVAATSALKNWDERNHEELEKILAVNKYQAAVLLQIAKNTESMSTSMSVTQLVAALNDINTRT